MLVATAQMSMSWTTEENVQTILDTNASAARLGVRAIYYPELAVTGYHREIVREVHNYLSDQHYWNSLKQSAVENELYLCVGHPMSKNGEVFNAYSCINPNGVCLGEIFKNGITETERLVFSAGKDRSVWSIENLIVSAFICREAADIHSLKNQFENQGIQLLAWPGYIGNKLFPDPRRPEGTREQAVAISKCLSTHIIQSNWADSLNNPEQKDLGGSVVLDRTGVLIGCCPDSIPGLGLFDMSSSEFRWQLL